METYQINNSQDLERFKDDFGYKINGNVEFNYSPDITGRLFVDGSITAGGYIEADWYIQAGGYIEASRYIKAGEYIQAGDDYGISAGRYITCKGTLSFGLNAYAGINTWGIATDEEKTITCSKLLKGNVEYGILKQTGEKPDDKIEIEGKFYSISEIKAKFGEK